MKTFFVKKYIFMAILIPLASQLSFADESLKVPKAPSIQEIHIQKKENTQSTSLDSSVCEIMKLSDKKRKDCHLFYSVGPWSTESIEILPENLEPQYKNLSDKEVALQILKENEDAIDHNFKVIKKLYKVTSKINFESGLLCSERTYILAGEVSNIWESLTSRDPITDEPFEHFIKLTHKSDLYFLLGDLNTAVITTDYYCSQ